MEMFVKLENLPLPHPKPDAAEFVGIVNGTR
jgi:hypothetical protein